MLLLLLFELVEGKNFVGVYDVEDGYRIEESDNEVFFDLLVFLLIVGVRNELDCMCSRESILSENEVFFEFLVEYV